MTRSRHIDHAALDGVLASQYSVITRSQALACGMTTSALAHWIRAGGPWQRLLPGVYLAETGTPTAEQRDMAALLYAGPGSAITGPAALRLWGVRAPQTSIIDVLIPAAQQRKTGGFVRVRLTRRMPEEVFTSGPRRYVPLARAVGDTARGLTRLSDVRALVATVVQQGKCSPAALAAELEDGPIQGSAMLRIAVADVHAGTRSSPEADLKDLIRRAKLPGPQFNPQLYAGEEFLGSPDAWWSEAVVAAEVDSHAYHLSPEDHERTRARAARMRAHGISVLSFTPQQIRTRPAEVAAAIRSALADARFRLPVADRVRIRAVPATAPPASTPAAVSAAAAAFAPVAALAARQHVAQP